jgi:hypothetical protein
MHVGSIFRQDAKFTFWIINRLHWTSVQQEVARCVFYTDIFQALIVKQHYNPHQTQMIGLLNIGDHFGFFNKLYSIFLTLLKTFQVRKYFRRQPWYSYFMIETDECLLQKVKWISSIKMYICIKMSTKTVFCVGWNYFDYLVFWCRRILLECFFPIISTENKIEHIWNK